MSLTWNPSRGVLAWSSGTMFSKWGRTCFCSQVFISKYFPWSFRISLTCQASAERQSGKCLILFPPLEGQEQLQPPGQSWLTPKKWRPCPRRAWQFSESPKEQTVTKRWNPRAPASPEEISRSAAHHPPQLNAPGIWTPSGLTESRKATSPKSLKRKIFYHISYDKETKSSPAKQLGHCHPLTLEGKWEAYRPGRSSDGLWSSKDSLSFSRLKLWPRTAIVPLQRQLDHKEHSTIASLKRRRVSQSCFTRSLFKWCKVQSYFSSATTPAHINQSLNRWHHRLHPVSQLLNISVQHGVADVAVHPAADIAPSEALMKLQGLSRGCLRGVA